jgi:hypothetical protein
MRPELLLLNEHKELRHKNPGGAIQWNKIQNPASRVQHPGFSNTIENIPLIGKNKIHEIHPIIGIAIAQKTPHTCCFCE